MTSGGTTKEAAGQRRAAFELLACGRATYVYQSAEPDSAEERREPRVRAQVVH